MRRNIRASTTVHRQFKRTGNFEQPQQKQTPSWDNGHGSSRVERIHVEKIEEVTLNLTSTVATTIITLLTKEWSGVCMYVWSRECTRAKFVSSIARLFRQIHRSEQADQEVLTPYVAVVPNTSLSVSARPWSTISNRHNHSWEGREDSASPSHTPRDQQLCFRQL